VNTTPAVGVAGLLGRPYKTIRLEWSSDLRLLRVRTCVKPIQCYSLAAMGEMQQVLDDISANPGLVRHLVMTSDVPKVFNFGGDLALFVLLVRAADLESLKLYGRRCIDLVWWLENAADIGVHTTVLSQGDTLGGGLESIMPFHKIIFERSAQAMAKELVARKLAACVVVGSPVESYFVWFCHAHPAVSSTKRDYSPVPYACRPDGCSQRLCRFPATGNPLRLPPPADSATLKPKSP
jgi:hypothetical protein